MPICPYCSATIHTGAEDQCPVCGYCLPHADEVFGKNQFEFTRVVDSAGALTHRERMDLLHTLEDLERYAPPIALGVYITDHGHARIFRPHAHWILNHAHIHHPSFGKREKKRAIQDAAITVCQPGERSLDDDEPQPPFPIRIWKWLRGKLHNHFHPLPPPVDKKWMLILVLDVQLKLACFTWGYMLDPYINPDKITSCIISARLQFREHAMVGALKRVMKQAVRQIAVSSHHVNKTMKPDPSFPARSMAIPLLASLALGAGMACPAAPVSPALLLSAKKNASSASKNKTASAVKPSSTPNKQKRTASRAASSSPKNAKTSSTASRKNSKAPSGKKNPPQAAPQPVHPALQANGIQFMDDDTAEEAEPDLPSPTPPPIIPPATPSVREPASSASGAPATYAAAPRWTEGDYTLIMGGQLATRYNLLIPSSPSPTSATSPTGKGAGESDTRVPGRSCALYSKPDIPSDLRDPQMLLSDVERNDILHVLREINQRSPYHIYVSLFKAGQTIPSELNAGTLVAAIAQPCQYAILLQYSLGDEPLVDLGYKEIRPSDEQRRTWLLQVRQAAFDQGGGTEGLLAAIRQVQSNMAPLASQLRPLTPESASKARLIDLPLKEQTKKKDPSFKEKLRHALESPAIERSLLGILFLAVMGIPLFVYLLHRRHTGSLRNSRPDYRLSSPYGAGVSRYVKYLEGKEATREKSIV